MRIGALVRGLLASTLVTACGDSTRPAQPGPGALTLVYTSPDDNTGALVLHVSGGPVDSIVPGGGGVYGSATADASGGSALIVGTLVNGVTVGKVYVPDVTSAAAYQVVVVEAANRVTNGQETPVTGTLRIVPPATLP